MAKLTTPEIEALDFISLFLEMHDLIWNDFDMFDEETGELIKVDLDGALALLAKVRNETTQS